jgi:uncharacterized protein YdbL (DUF1318 family)
MIQRWGIIVLALALFGCARVKVEAPKDPIKVDISMRLDIYQHIEKDINAIEDLISGDKKESKAPAPGPQSRLLNFLETPAYAQDLSPEVEQAAMNRKERRSQLMELELKGIVGENQRGLVEVRDVANGMDAQVIVSAENSDRMTIYNSLAAKNGSTLEDVEKLYAKRLQDDAPVGAPIETDAGWKSK